MYEITIKGETLADLTINVAHLAESLMPSGATLAPKATRSPRKAAEPQPEPEPVNQRPIGAEDAALQAELNAPVDPMPATAAAVVDAGTGQPIATAGGVPKSEPPLQMTFDDVKLAAGKLAAKDMTKLAALLKKYGAANLSGVPKDKLGDFAMDVLEANET